MSQAKNQSYPHARLPLHSNLLLAIIVTSPRQNGFAESVKTYNVFLEQKQNYANHATLFLQFSKKRCNRVTLFRDPQQLNYLKSEILCHYTTATVD